ncbi:alkaline shock response membrane anchor protein AmaP [Streptomyces sp. AV19]|uniref:alkaline shock response membrane anchor protein AmaP n=1 Tax=Streptomyces sp. AV19 TaxID=2793068 RepID=UPI0024137892|nr:alkaline shock response membrane anchor protein AmaP [Streptomyces sp. AV19]MDG4532501.1 alkaline shock response membrane anchor protein AmaP [Streptomyces sp. AV19]
MLRLFNRVLLGLAGLLLAGLGAAVLVGALDLPRHWDFSLPSAWPFQGPDDVLLTAADRRRWRGRGWWWPVVLGALAVVLLLAVWWLVAQLRRRRVRDMVLGGGEPDDPVVIVRGHALEEALAAEAGALDGVERAGVVLVGRRNAPRARVVLVLGAGAVPDVVLRRFRAEVLGAARTSAGLARLPAEVRLRAVRHRAERVG